MVTIRIALLTLLFSLNLFAATDLGKELAFKTKPTGEPAFGATYTYGGDPDGTSYLFTFTPKVSATEATKQLRWNYYLRSSDSFLLDWSKDRVASLSVFQIRLSDEKLETTIEKIIRGQKPEKDGELFLVLADDKNKPQYFISVSELCSKYPDNFNDLSHSKRCDKAKL